MFGALRSEEGIYSIVERMQALAKERQVHLFECDLPDIDMEFASRYTTLLASMIEPRYEWFYTDQVASKQIKTLLVSQDNFPELIELL